MSIKAISDKATWDKFVDESPYGLIFHKWDFLKIVEKHSDCSLIPYGVYKGDKLICLFPLFVKTYMGKKFVFSPPPRTGIPCLGFLMSEIYDTVKQSRKESYLDNAIEEVSDELKKLSPSYVSIATVHRFTDIRPFKWKGYDIGITYTYMIDLDRPIDQIWKSFDDTCKKKLKNCDKYSLTMKEVSDAKQFYDIMARRYIEQGLRFPVKSSEYLQELMAAYPDNLKMYFLYNGDQIVGNELICMYKDTLTIWLGESTIQKDIPATYYMRWELIKKAKAEGFKHLEIEGGNTRRLCANKALFNPTLEPGFLVTKRDTLGRLAAWTYQNVIKRQALI